MLMACGEVDSGHCVGFDACMSGSHASCDTSLKDAQLLAKFEAYPGLDAYAPEPFERFPSHHPELLLRPPRNA